jgi:hypothetical protein
MERRELARLIDQQWWCWGRDVCHPEGNLLLRLGLCRSRPAVPSRDGTLYSARVEEHSAIYLWGFGAYYVEEARGGLYVGRTGNFAPRRSERPDAWGLHSSDELMAISRPLQPRDLPQAAALFEGLARWIARYEHWLAENLGVEYRRQCLEGWKKKPVCAAHDLAAAWEEIARKSRRLLGASPAKPWHPWQGMLHQLRCRVRHQAWNCAL